MVITLTIDDSVREAGIAAAASAHNASQPVTDPPTAPLTPEQYMQAMVDGAADSYVAMHRVGIVSSGEYVLRFTAAENAAIGVAAQTDPIIANSLARVRSLGEVQLYSNEMVQGMSYLVAQGLLTQARADEILAY